MCSCSCEGAGAELPSPFRRQLNSATSELLWSYSSSNLGGRTLPKPSWNCLSGWLMCGLAGVGSLPTATAHWGRPDRSTTATHVHHAGVPGPEMGDTAADWSDVGYSVTVTFSSNISLTCCCSPVMHCNPAFQAEMADHDEDTTLSQYITLTTSLDYLTQSWHPSYQVLPFPTSL